MSETTKSGLLHVFPAEKGLKVVVVETDVSYLQELLQLLQNFHYQVTQCTRADEALSFLKDDNAKFDVVVADFDTIDMNELDFLSSAIATSSLPIVGFSVNRDRNYIELCLVRGVSGLLEKPVSREGMGMLWQLVVCQKLHLSRTSSDLLTTTINNTPQQKTGKKHAPNNDDATSKLKPRFVWKKQAKALFVEAVNYLGGPDNAAPKRIHEYMIDRGINKELNIRHISSHLQKYRADMKLLLLQQQKQQQGSSAQQMQMQMQMQMQRSSVPFQMLNHSTNTTTLVPNYLPYKSSNPPYPSSSSSSSSSSSVQLPGFKNMYSSSQTELFLQGGSSSYLEPPCSFLCNPNNNGSSPSPSSSSARSTMFNPNSNSGVVFENEVINYHDPSNYDQVVLPGNGSADNYQIVMEPLIMMDDQYHHLPYQLDIDDDQDQQQFLSNYYNDVALTDQVAPFNQEAVDVNLSIDDQGSMRLIDSDQVVDQIGG